MTMMDPAPATPEPTDPRLNAIYNLHGRLHIFLPTPRDEEPCLVPVTGATTDIRSCWTDQAELVATPGSDLWVKKMVEFRNLLTDDLRSARADADRERTRYKNLGEAILAEAKEREWCEEYDAFADKWGLPPREHPYNVVIRIKVLANSLEEAEERVRVEIEDEHLADGPSFEVREHGE